MAIEPWRKLTEEVLVQNKYVKFIRTTFEMPNGKTGEYFHVAKLDGCMIIAIRDDGKIAMVRQYRLPTNQITLEFPAGGLQPGKDMEATALAELTEEIKFSAHRIQPYGQFYASEGLTSQCGYVFVASDLYPHAQPGDDTEDIEVVWYTEAEIDQLIARRELTNGWSLSSWLLARPRVSQICAEKLANLKA